MEINKYLNRCDIYTLLWCYYVWHSTTVESASTLSQLVLLLCLLWSTYHMLYEVSHYKLPVYFKGLNILVVMYFIYGFIRFAQGRYVLPGGEIDSLYSFKKICISLLPIYSFFHFSIIGLLDEKRLKRYSLFFLILVFMAYSAYYTKRYGVVLEAEYEYTNNIGYLFLALIPIISFWRPKPLFFYLFLGLTILMIVTCMKRGAIVSGAVALVITLFYSLKSMARGRRFFVLILSVILLVALFMYVSWLYENSTYFIYRYNATMAGDANGRDEMYPRFLQYILYKSSNISLIFGDGFDGSLKNLGIYCHNDWFEITIDHGVIGFCLFIFYWFCFHKNVRLLAEDLMCYLPVLLVLAITFCNTLFSFSINNMSIFITCVLGYCLSKTINDQKQYHNG